MVESQIVVKRHDMPLGHHYHTFEWQGPRCGIAYVYYWDYERFKNQFPWKLKVIGEDFPSASLLVARCDGANAPVAYYYWLKEMVTKLAVSIKYKAIMTAVIWGIARAPRVGEVLSWRLLFKRGGEK